MRNLALASFSGVQNRLFANWLKLRDMNTVNDLIEKGFIKAMEGRMIALHPMMQEVTIPASSVIFRKAVRSMISVSTALLQLRAAMTVFLCLLAITRVSSADAMLPVI